MIKEAFDLGIQYALSQLGMSKHAKALPGGALTLAENYAAKAAPKAVDKVRRAPSAESGERVLDYSSWARKPTSLPPVKTHEVPPLSEKAREAMRAFNYNK